MGGQRREEGRTREETQEARERQAGRYLVPDCRQDRKALGCEVQGWRLN